MKLSVLTIFVNWYISQVPIYAITLDSLMRPHVGVEAHTPLHRGPPRIPTARMGLRFEPHDGLVGLGRYGFRRT